MIPVEEARRLILKDAAPMPAETVSVAEAAGRVLAEPVIAAVTQPPFAASAMDGYALSASDVGGTPPFHLTMIGEAPAGMPFDGLVGPGRAVRIFTGGALPDGTDTVVIQENTVAEGTAVTVTAAAAPGANVRAAGVDFRAGDTLLPAGRALDGPAIALAAAGNVRALSVHRRPTIALMATGDELVPPGSRLGPGQIVNSISPGLAALAEDWGARVVHRGHAGDSEAAIQAEIGSLTAADIAVVIGGASVGEYDLVKAALGARGLETAFEKVAVKPGKPVWCGRLGATRVIGLPGNPASALVTAWLFLKPLVWALSGRDAAQATHPVTARLTAPLPANGPRESYLRSRLSVEDGRLTVTADDRQDSSLLSPFADAGGLVRRPPRAPAAAPGDPVPVIPMRPIA